MKAYRASIDAAIKAAGGVGVPPPPPAAPADPGFMEEFGYGLEGFRPDFQPPQAAIEKTSEELMEEARREGAKTEP